MSKHTPGPWTAHDIEPSLITIESDSPQANNTHYIAEIDTRSATHDTDRANARLIAAAPELLALLNSLADQALSWHAYFSHDCERPCEFETTFRAAFAAIASATGEE